MYATLTAPFKGGNCRIGSRQYMVRNYTVRVPAEDARFLMTRGYRETPFQEKVNVTVVVIDENRPWGWRPVGDERRT